MTNLSKSCVEADFLAGFWLKIHKFDKPTLFFNHSCLSHHLPMAGFVQSQISSEMVPETCPYRDWRNLEPIMLCPPKPESMTVQTLRKKFTVGQYHQMLESGILTDRDRVELLQGEIIEISPIGRRHAACVDRLTELFVGELRGKAIVRVQNPVQLSGNSEPEPDFAILRRKPDFYAEGHPQSSDVFALIEVSDTTLEFDRTVKTHLYAQNQIAEVWIIDLTAATVQIYREPSASGYQQLQTFRRGQSIAFQALDEVQFTLEQIFG